MRDLNYTACLPRYNAGMSEERRQPPSNNAILALCAVAWGLLLWGGVPIMFAKWRATQLLNSDPIDIQNGNLAIEWITWGASSRFVVPVYIGAALMMCVVALFLSNAYRQHRANGLNSP